MICPQVDAPTTSIARDQEEFLESTAALVTNPEYTVALGYNHNTVLLAFRPNEEERRRLRAGDDLYIAILTGGQPINPIMLHVGREEAAAAFKIGVRL
jgi:hypothetical protein